VTVADGLGEVGDLRTEERVVELVVEALVGHHVALTVLEHDQEQDAGLVPGLLQAVLEELALGLGLDVTDAVLEPGEDDDADLARGLGLGAGDCIGDELLLPAREAGEQHQLVDGVAETVHDSLLSRS